MENEKPDRIPYKVWMNSQLSVVQYYGAIDCNGSRYELDYDNCETQEINGEIKYFPDLVKVS